jgi:hypothetical protein
MLSHPYKYDYCLVLSILKSKKVTRLPDSVEAEYPSARDFFSVEMVKEIDSSVWVDLEHAVTPWVKMSRYNALTTPFSLTHAAGLADDEEAVGRYLEIEVNEEVQNEINWAWGGMYYTPLDLDRTGDGDANDVGDIDEDTLKMYYFDESAGKWTELSADTGVDTTDDELYGKNYEGYVWANVSHFSLYGLAGIPRLTPKNYVESSTGSGTVYFENDAGTMENIAAVDEATLPEEGKPALVFPHGFFSFDITGLSAGQTVTVTLTLPDSIPVGAQYWKYHASEGGWVRIPMGSDDGDNVITITLTDGGLGDDDGVADGVIVDQGGPGSSSSIPVPEFNTVGLLALIGLLAVVLLSRVRKKKK